MSWQQNVNSKTTMHKNVQKKNMQKLQIHSKSMFLGINQSYKIRI